MTIPLVSICMLTVDRYQMTKICLENLLKKSGLPRHDIELLVLDNGSKENRVDILGEIPQLHLFMPTNIGVAAGFNKLFRGAKGKYICLVGNDIWLEQNWLVDLLKNHARIENSGVAAIHCVLPKGNFNTKMGVFIPEHQLVYGVSLWHRSLFDKIGGFDERLTGYGCEDSQFCWRAHSTGHTNFYIPGQNSYHLCDDQGSDTEYRKKKDQAFARNVKVLQETMAKMKQSNNYKIPL